jgi:hypothetical protein
MLKIALNHMFVLMLVQIAIVQSETYTNCFRGLNG